MIFGIHNAIVVIVFVASVTSPVAVAVYAICEQIDRAALAVVTAVAVCVAAVEAIEGGGVVAVDHAVAIVIVITCIAGAVGVMIEAIARWPRLAQAF
jgi:hypothetical protein